MTTLRGAWLLRGMVTRTGTVMTPVEVPEPLIDMVWHRAFERCLTFEDRPIEEDQ